MTDHRRDHSLIPLKEDSPIMCDTCHSLALFVAFSVIFCYFGADSWCQERWHLTPSSHTTSIYLLVEKIKKKSKEREDRDVIKKHTEYEIWEEDEKDSKKGRKEECERKEESEMEEVCEREWEEKRMAKEQKRSNRYFIFHRIFFLPSMTVTCIINM